MSLRILLNKSERICLCGCGKEINIDVSDYFSYGHRKNLEGMEGPFCLCECDQMTTFNFNNYDWNDYVTGHNSRTEEFRDIIIPIQSKRMKESWKDSKYRDKMSLRMKGREITWGDKISKAKKGKCTGSKSYFFGKSPTETRKNWNWSEYILRNGSVIKVMSSFEIRMCKILDCLDFDWRYCRDTRFSYTLPNGIKHTYVPDFEINNGQFYIETKGWFRDNDIEKMMLVRKQNPDLIILVVTEDILKMYEKVIDKDRLKECENRVVMKEKRPLCACKCGNLVNKNYRGIKWNVYLNGHNDIHEKRKFL